MPDRLDELLNQLKALPPGRPLDRLESAVLERIHKRSSADIFGGPAFQVQVAVTCGALLLGLVIAKVAGFAVMPTPLMSEIVVLSDDGALAPSVRLEGGL